MRLLSKKQLGSGADQSSHPDRESGLLNTNATVWERTRDKYRRLAIIQPVVAADQLGVFGAGDSLL